MRALIWSSMLSVLVVSILPAQTKTVAERLGHPANSKLLIIHADDLAAAHSIDAASFDALEKGAVTSASVMVPTPWITEVAAYARTHPNADLGLHLTLTSEWETYRWGAPLGPSLTDKDVLLDAVVIADPQIPRDQWKAFYLKTIADLKPGLTELIVHLGHDDSELQAVTVNHEPYGSAWRQRDYEVMFSPEFKKALRDNHIILVTWRELGKLVQQP